MLSDRQLLDSLSRMPLVDTRELAGVLGEAHATVHRALTGLLVDGIAGRVSHGTAQLPSSQRYYLMAKGIDEAAEIRLCDGPQICVNLALACTMMQRDGHEIYLEHAERALARTLGGGARFPPLDSLQLLSRNAGSPAHVVSGATG